MSNAPRRTVDHRRDLGGSLGLHAGDHVGVLFERERQRLVAEALCDDLDRDPGLQGEGGMRVAQVVEADRPQRGLGDQPLEGLAEGVRVDRLAVLFGDHEVLVSVVGAPLGPLLVLALPALAELGDGLGVEIDHPRAVALWRRVDDLVADGDQRLADRQALAVQVDGAPAQAEDLAAAHPGHRGRPPDAGKPAVGRGRQERGKLIRVPRLHARGRRAAWRAAAWRAAAWRAAAWRAAAWRAAAWRAAAWRAAAWRARPGCAPAGRRRRRQRAPCG